MKRHLDNFHQKTFNLIIREKQEVEETKIANTSKKVNLNKMKVHKQRKDKKAKTKKIDIKIDE